MQDTPARPIISIADRLDRLQFTKRHAAIVLIGALGLLFDVIEAR